MLRAVTAAEIRILGPVQLWIDNVQHSLGPKQVRAVFTVLALSVGQTIPDQTLIGRIWPDEQPDGARDTLGSYITRLRRCLEAAGAPVEIARPAGGYALIAENETVDLQRFRRLLRQARAICDSGDERRAVALLHEAEALWRGPPFADLPLDGWFAGVRMRLAEERRAARLLRIDAELRLGMHRELVGELTSLLANHPRDEEIAAALMIALYRSNRQSEALLTYHEIRDRLRDESGLDPGGDLQELYAQILRHDTALAVTPVHRRPDLQTQPNNLPPAPAHFTGRAEEIATLTGLRDPAEGDGAVIEVVEGMAGVGKTGLALVAGHRMADRYPDAQIFLSLSGNDPAHPPLAPDDALARLLNLIGVPPTRVPQSPGERETLWRNETATRRALLILDDAADEEQIRPLLPASSSCLTLLTSRTRLRDIESIARITQLGPLRPRESADLFTRIAGPEHIPSDETLTRILDRCGHLPLTIQISASHVHREGTVARFSATTPPADAESVDQVAPAVRLALDASYQRLDDAVQRTYRLLGAQPCPTMTVEATSVLVDTTVEVVEPLVGTLLGHHLLESAEHGRLSFHDVLHQHAREHAHTDDSERDRRQAIYRLVTYYLSRVREADDLLYQRSSAHGDLAGPADVSRFASPQHAHDWLDAEWRNILHVAEYSSEHEWQRECAELTHAIAEYLDTQGLWLEAIRTHERAIRSGREVDDRRLTAAAQFDLGFAHFRTGNIAESIDTASESLSLYQRLDSKRDQARALDLIGVAHWASAHYREAVAYINESYAIYDAIADDRGKADALSHIAVASWHLGRYEESINGFHDALAIYQRIGDKRGEAKALNNVGDVYQHRGLHRDAYLHYQKSLDIFTEITGAQNHAILLNNLGNVYQYKGEYEKALRSYRAAIATYRNTGDRRNESDALNNIGCTYHQMNKNTEALVHHDAARIIAEEITDSFELTRAYIGLGDAHRGERSDVEALPNYGEALNLARSTGDIYHEARAHTGIAELELHRTGVQEARIHWRKALDIFEHLGLPEATAVRIRLQVQQNIET